MTKHANDATNNGLVSRSRRHSAVLMMGLTLALVGAEPAFAQATGIQTALESLIDMITGGVGKALAVLAIMGVTEANKVFLSRWIERLVRGGRTITTNEQRAIEQAITALGQLDRRDRSIGALIQFLDTTDPEGVASRLRRWAAGGALGWVFDNEGDAIGEGAQFLGYDMTDFLDNEEIRMPLMFYLFHRVEQMIDGRRIVVVIDEFWKALADEGFRDFVQNKLKTIRKQNGLMVFATQSPRDAISSPIAHTVIEQCGTQIRSM